MKQPIASRDDVGLILQPILTYITYALQSATADNVSSAILRHCAAKDIADAKQTLWERCGGDVIGVQMPRRRETHARSIEEAHVYDIIVALQKLDDQDALPNFAVDFQSLGKIPRWHPEEINAASLAERMLVMEQRMYQLQQAVDRHAAENLVINEKMRQPATSYAQAIGTNISAPPLTTSSRCEATPPDVNAPPPARTPQPTRKGAPTIINGRGRVTEGSVTGGRGERLEAHDIISQNRFAALERAPSAASLVSALSDSSCAQTRTRRHEDADGFQVPTHIVRQQRRDENRRKRIITGRRNAGGGRFRGAPEAGRDLFIYRVHTDTVATDIHELVKSVGYDVLRLECVSNPNAKFKSFRMTVPASQYSKVHSESFPWPMGVRVRRFVQPPKSRQPAQQNLHAEPVVLRTICDD